MPRYESDVCIIGAGITTAMIAEKLAELRPNATIQIVEAGKALFDFENRMEYRKRSLDYKENPWVGDYIDDQSAQGIISRTMAVGGSALHWGGTCNRFSEEDLRLTSLFGLYTDWPIAWNELEKYYCEAERRIGVSGHPSPLPEDRRSEPYPMPAMPLSHNLAELKKYSERSGVPFWGTPQAKTTVAYGGRNACIRCGTCSICPTGARYSPDFTFKQLLAKKKITLHTQTLVRRLILSEKTGDIVAASAVNRAKPDDAVEYRAQVFIVASGYTWTPHLLLLSANSRFPNGLANSSGLVGRYMNGHSFMTGFLTTKANIFPGMNESYGLISRRYFRTKPDNFVRHDLRMWESAVAREPRLKAADGKLLLGDDLLTDWRARATANGTARIRAYLDVHPSRDSSLTLDASKKNNWGDPLPKIEHRFDAETNARGPRVAQHVRALFEDVAKANEGKLISFNVSNYLDHPAGGCRMGTDAKESVCDGFGRTHDHPNLFVPGAPTLPNAGCTNGTLTFVKLALRSAQHIADTWKS